MVLVSLLEFQQAVKDNGFRKPTETQYDNFINRAGPVGDITTRRELAMFLANVIQETAGLTVIAETNPQPGAYNTVWDDTKPVKGKEYYGRGYIQLSYPGNYRKASRDLYDLYKKLGKQEYCKLYENENLLAHPDLVATNEGVAWDTAFWFWKANVRGKPGVSDGQFGATVNAINGPIECNSANTDGVKKAKNRFGFYGKIFRLWNIDPNGKPDERGCYACS